MCAPWHFVCYALRDNRRMCSLPSCLRTCPAALAKVVMSCSSCRDDRAVQGWWQQLQSCSPAQWLCSSIQSGMRDGQDGSPAPGQRGAAHSQSQSQPQSQSRSPSPQTKLGTAGFASIPGPPPLEGQVLSLQRALKDEPSDAKLAAACGDMSAEMTAGQVGSSVSMHARPSQEAHASFA